MIKYPNNYDFKHSDEMSHYFDVLRKIYHINIAKFMRAAILEKLQRDMPKIRADYKKKSNKGLPF